MNAEGAEWERWNISCFEILRIWIQAEIKRVGPPIPFTFVRLFTGKGTMSNSVNYCQYATLSSANAMVM